MITYLLFYRIPLQIAIRYAGEETKYDVHWNSTVKEMKRRVVDSKKHGDVSGSMVLVYDGEELGNDVKWYTTSILGKDHVILHLWKR